MKDTQLEAWDSIQEKIPKSRRRVLQMIQMAGEYGVTTYNVAQRLEWPINCVSGRITELSDAGLIVDSGRRGVNPSGKKAVLWILNPDSIELTINELPF